ncbi:hypothetical protein SPRG_09892 [Saprolegnia parasitica CBS 223.65]|uniref:PHD-type domain-containing protein n=1 Tax=Saprolegnia parasitica (strain CBS 223.65) TaxID=695850 RepID=A0A067CBT1_SAPPC|nr:hypothetical protein SPRG_09892 [Saprolegnia parasitica CBS 223.65]KDO24257.1 hypothetical protein SPRG_09892 [Saprolegnia parasitica CBS 223.65]|eukprot:XP_012205030.1 hypothetical protein SPRG_09892 [Saprolegnia parasitica CBS 223.65]
MLKLGRGHVQMQYEPCETCGKSRVVALDTSAVPAAQNATTDAAPPPVERLISDMCRCKRRRVAPPKALETSDAASTPKGRGSDGGTPRRRPPATYDPDDGDDDDVDGDDDDDDDGKDDTYVDSEEYTAPRRAPVGASPEQLARRHVAPGNFLPRCLRVRLRKVEGGYTAVPPTLPITAPARDPLIVRLHRIGDGAYVALDNSHSSVSSSLRKRRLEFASDAAESDSSDSGVSSGAESAPSAPSSPVRKPHPEAAIPESLTLHDLPVAPWDRRAPGMANRTQCEVCGKSGTLACCERCPAVYHNDCLPMDHPLDDVDPWWCPRCLQTPIGQQTKACRLCSSDSNLSQIILCDCCDDEYHLYCLVPPLTDVPSGDWFCPFCHSHNHVKRQCIKKKRKGRKKKRPLQFYYPSLLQETYEDLSILHRGRRFRPPSYGKIWTPDDDRKLGNHQRKLRTLRDKVNARTFVKPDLSKRDLHANAPYLQDIIVDSKALTGMFHMVDAAAARARSRNEGLAQQVAEYPRWRVDWPRADEATDVYLRLLSCASDCLQLLVPSKIEPPPRPVPTRTQFHAPSAFAVPIPNLHAYEAESRLHLGQRIDKAREVSLDPWILMRMEALRINDPMALHLLLNSDA